MFDQAVFQAQTLHNAEVRQMCREALEAARTAQLELVNLSHSRSLLRLELLTERADHRLTMALRPLAVQRQDRRRRRSRRLTRASSGSRQSPLSATTESPPSDSDSEATSAEPTYEEMIRQAAMLEEMIAEEAAADTQARRIVIKEEPADDGYGASA